MIPEDAWRLVPGDIPDDLPGWVTRFAEASGFDEREVRSYAWAVHLLGQLSDQALSTAITGVTEEVATLEDISAGFIPVPVEDELSLRSARINSEDVQLITVADTRFAFGVVVGISTARSREAEGAADAELEPRTPGAMVHVAGFPIVVDFREVIEHTPPHPIGVTSACYARPRASKRFFGPVWSSGIVIARHVLRSVGFSYGSAVKMGSGQSATIVDIDSSTTIDAAILDASACSGQPIHRLTLAPSVAPGSRVDIRTRRPSGFSADVLRVWDHPSHFGNMVAHRIFLDSVGATGDSGSLVSRSPASDVAGLYIGSTGGSQAEGLVQSMRQVVQYFDVELYD